MPRRNANTAVSLAQCRPGAVIEFCVTHSMHYLGTVERIHVQGPRHYVVSLSRKEHLTTGEVINGIDPVTGCRPGVHLSHAKRVVSPGHGAVVFDAGNAALYREDRMAHVASGAVVRKGQRLVMRAYLLSSVARDEVMIFLKDNERQLGLQPTEFVDIEGLQEALFRTGIVRSFSCWYDNAAAMGEINILRMKKFIRQNLGRFKFNLDKYQRELEEYDEAEYRREYGSEGRSALSYLDEAIESIC